MSSPMRCSGWKGCSTTMAAGPARRRSRPRSSCPTGSWIARRAGVPAAAGQSRPGCIHRRCRGPGRAGGQRDAGGARPAGQGSSGRRLRLVRRAGGGCMTCCTCTPGSCRMPTPMRTGGSRPGTGCWTTTWTTADAAADHLRALPGTPVPAAFSGRDAALAWLDGERASLIAAVTLAANTGRDQIAMLLPLNLGGYLSWWRRFDDWLAVASISRDAARRLGDRTNEAVTLTNLGAALVEMRPVSGGDQRAPGRGRDLPGDR